ncbi:hypothetical protein [Entomobacter blattae]|uniref:hypothetical protein n=1 Tax=Entomobacter blattae TaxID=2762277 RepID=UPI00193C5049|nr:hypothetical protein [Entomobacter blattae]
MIFARKIVDILKGPKALPQKVGNNLVEIKEKSFQDKRATDGSKNSFVNAIVFFTNFLILCNKA